MMDHRTKQMRRRITPYVLPTCGARSDFYTVGASPVARFFFSTGQATYLVMDRPARRKNHLHHRRLEKDLAWPKPN